MAEFKVGDWVTLKPFERLSFERRLVERGGKISPYNIYQIERISYGECKFKDCNWGFAESRFLRSPPPKKLNKPLSSYL